jgi:putative transposase
MFADPYNARSKIVERFFLTFGDQLERLVPSYCGSGIQDKPAWMARNEKFHQAWHQARSSGWVPNVREAAYLISLYFKWYAEQAHSGVGGRLPIDIFNEGRGPGVDERELGEQMLWAITVTPRRCRVTLYGIDYEADCLHGLRPDVKSVIARYDTSDLSRVHCYLRESGEYLGDAYPVQALPPIARLLGDEVGLDQVQQAIKRQRRLAKQTKSCLEEMGVSREATDTLKALPWNRKAAVLLPGGAAGTRGDGERETRGCGDGETRGPGDTEISQAERARLELVVSRAEEEIAKEAAKEMAPDRPEYFHSQVERYEWCFRSRYQHGFELSEADSAFMPFFEAEPEFENYRQRYADLRELFEMQGVGSEQ